MEKRNVAILGGGIGGLAAAYYLSDTEAKRERFNVTIYESRWVPGGKCASGRNLTNGRIEEHGLHMFFGAYHNTARMIRDCYASLRQHEDLPYRDWDAAFEGHEDVYFMEKRGRGWQAWDVDPLTPRTEGRPGDDSRTLWEMLIEVLGSLDGGNWNLPALAVSGRARKELRRARQQCTSRPRAPTPPPKESIERKAVESAIRLLAHSWQSWGRKTMLLGRWLTGVRRIEAVLDVALAALLGLVEEDLLDGPDYLHKADDIDLKEFLAKYGCVHTEAAPIRGFYSGLFAFPVGNSEGRLAAGVGLRALLRSFADYQGDIVWRMRGGMGEVVILPLYRVLVSRGVRFKFFHKLTHIDTDDTVGNVTALRFACLATPKGSTYDPETVVELPSGRRVAAFPSEPEYAQLTEEVRLAELRPQLGRLWPLSDESSPRVQLPLRGTERDDAQGECFDDVILAIPPEALKHVEQEFCRNEAWQEFLHGRWRTQSVPTIGLQCWLDRNLDEMGWNGLERDFIARLYGLFSSEPPEQPIVGAFERPFDVWADMTHLTAFERSPAKHKAYFVGVRSTRREVPPRPELWNQAQLDEEATVRDQFRQWLEQHAHHLWPGVVKARGDVDWTAFADSLGRTGSERLLAQYVAVSLEPSDEYVLSLPGTIAMRPPADGWGIYGNLSLAGDWIKNGLNAGTLEGAAMGGIEAANCVLGRSGLPLVDLTHASEI